MKKSLLSHTQLSQAKRLLFMTHMAIGDYVYQRMFLKKLAESYPNLKIDLWFDHCTIKTESWNVRRAQTLSDWFNNEPFLHNLYPVVLSPIEREALISKAQQENYDIIVFSVDTGCELYAEIAQAISKTAYIVGTWTKLSKFILKKYKIFNQCHGFIMDRGSLARHPIHITQFYQKRFAKIFGLTLTPEEIKPRMTVPEVWKEKMRIWLDNQKQGYHHPASSNGTFFINYLSSQDKRNWTLDQVIQLIIELNQQHSHWTYIINLPPHALVEIQEILSQERSLDNIHVLPFTAENNFYELPALIQLSDFVLSVETAVIHLASALDIPQIALVRYKARTWAPYPNKKTSVIFTRKSPTRIANITVEEVLKKYREMNPSIESTLVDD